MTKIVVLLTTLPEEAKQQYFAGIRNAFPDLAVELVDRIETADQPMAEADILVTFGPHLGEHADHVVAMGRKLQWIQALGTGVDNIVNVPSLRPETMVTNMHGMHGVPMTEAALLAMLSLSRNAPLLFRNQARQRWERFPPNLLYGRTAGIFGVGAIATMLAPQLKSLGMRVIGISSGKRPVAGFDRIYGREELAVAVREVDFLILLTPYSAETHNLVDAKVLAAMKPTSFLINLARGGVVDEGALLDALRAGRIAGAALDVFAAEPLPEDHPFWAMENVIVSPHLGGFNDSYVAQTLPVLLENIRRFVAGEFDAMLNIVRRGAPARGGR